MECVKVVVYTSRPCGEKGGVSLDFLIRAVWTVKTCDDQGRGLMAHASLFIQYLFVGQAPKVPKRAVSL